MHPLSSQFPDEPGNDGSQTSREQVPNFKAREGSREEIEAANAELREANERLRAKVEELSQSHNEWEALLASADIVMVFLDPNGRLKDYTPHAQQLFDLQPGDMGRPFIDLQHGFGNEGVMDDVQRVRQTQKPMEREMHTDDGRWLLSRLSPHNGEGDNRDCVVITFVDITKSKQAERAQRDSEERMRLIVESAKDYAIFTMDLERRVNSWNTGAEAMCGFSEEEILGQLADIVFTPEDRAKGDPKKEVEKAAREGRAENERWHLRKDGSRFYGSGLNMPLRDEGGALIGFVKIMRDLTAHKRAEDALHESHERTVEILESISDAFYTVDANFCFTYINKKAEEWWGRSRESLLGKHFDSEFPQVVGTETYQMHLRAFEERRPQHYETLSPIVGHWVEVNIYPDNKGGLSVYFFDITTRKKAEEALRESEERFRALISQGSDMITLSDAQGQILFASPSTERVSGYPPEEFMALHPFDTIHPDDQARCGEAMRQLVETPGLMLELQHRVRHKDGTWRWIEGTFTSLFHVPAVGGLVANVRDITERKLAEDALRASEERLRLAVEAGHIGTCDWDYASGEMHWNETRFRLYGMEPQERMMHISELYPIVHPDDRERLRFELKSGIEERGEHSEQYRVVWPSGRVRWIHETGRVVEWNEGRPARVISVLFDVTLAREAQDVLLRSQEELEALVQERTRELEQALEQLRTEIGQRRRAEMGRIELMRRIVNTQEEERGRISRELHDNLGQHLTAVMLGLQALEMEISSIVGGERQGGAPQLDNLRSLVDGLMKAAHRQAWELRPAELDALGLEAALGQYVRDWSERTGIEVDFQAVDWERRPGPEVETTLYRVVQEALTNVIRHADATLVSVVLEQNAETVQVIIEDDGNGFDTEQTTGRLGVLGMEERLALVGGTLDIESIPDEGTAVFARVPVASV